MSSRRKRGRKCGLLMQISFINKGSASVVHHKLGKGTVTYIGTDTDDGKLEKDVMRRVYEEAKVTVDDLPYGVVKEWRDGFMWL